MSRPKALNNIMQNYPLNKWVFFSNISKCGYRFFSIVLTFGLILPVVFAQPETTKLNKSSVQTSEVSRDRREKSFAKLLEAQRHFWGISRANSLAAQSELVNSARQALLKAVEHNPHLSEAYSLLAELTAKFPPNDLDEAINFGNLAIKLNPDNFGAHHILAVIYTAQSRINTDDLDLSSTQKAMIEWKEVTRLDPKNAEAWAFLSEFYGRTKQTEEQLASLKKWLSASSAQDEGFYRRIFGPEESLKPENASLKLGETFVKAGRYSEAIEFLGQSIVENPENLLAVDLLRQAIKNNENTTSQKTLEILQQTAFANPHNLVLIELLAEYQTQLGQAEEAVKTLQSTLSKLPKGNNISIANLQIVIGDIYLQSNQSIEAVVAYEEALKLFGIEKLKIDGEEVREFATRVFEKIIRIYKISGKVLEARNVIERARLVLGKSDLFPDKQLITFLQETGKKSEALETVRLTRKKFAADYGLIRLEAMILTELGRVDEAVSLIKSLITKKSAVPSPYYDDFSNYLFISGLYTQVKRNKEAVISAQQAIAIAESEDRKQLANLSLATAQHQGGDFKAAETILRNILKRTPENPIALNNLGYFLIERDEKFNEAVEMIKKALKIDSDNPSYLDSLGWGYFKLGKFDEAERILKQALRLNPTSVNIYEHLGDVYLKQGKVELANSVWQKALNLARDTEAVARLKAKMIKISHN